MATIYSKTVTDVYNGLSYRTKLDYSITSTSTTVTISATIQLQSKGTYKSGSSDGGAYAQATISRVITAETSFHSSAINPTSSSTSWTNRGSAITKSKTFNKETTPYNVKISAGVSSRSAYYDYPELVANTTDATITIPALASYAVTYNANGGSNGPSSQTKYYGKTLTLSSVTPTKTGYSFYHWNTNSSNSGTTYNPGGSYTGNAALTLYAIWNPIINYNANGGSGAPSSQTKTYGTSLTLSSTVPTRSGYRFKGWNTKADGSGTPYLAGGTYSSNATATLYAQWSSLPKKPTISTMTAIRWDESEDVQDDEGTSAKIQAYWSIDLTSDEYGDENTATTTLAVTPQSGSSSGITITPVSGTSGTSGTAIYMVSGLSTDMQYTVTIRVDDEVSYSTKAVILTRAFFIMDFKAGGGAIGIGRAAPANGLEVGYDTTFDGDVTAREDFDIYGDLSAGGAISGASATFSGDVNAHLFTAKKNFASDATGSQSERAFGVTSSDDKLLGVIQARRTANGENGISFGAIRDVGSASPVTNWLTSYIDASGNRSWTISELAPFLEMLGLTTTVATTSISTTLSGASLVSHQIARNGKTRTLRLTVKKSSATPVGQNVYEGTIDTASDRPAVLVNGMGYYASSGVILQVNTNGEIKCRVIGAQLAANAEVYISVTYLVQ